MALNFLYVNLKLHIKMKLYISQIPFIRIAIPFIAGILFADYFYNYYKFESTTVFYTLLVLITVFVASFFIKAKYYKLQNILLNVFSLLIFFTIAYGLYTQKANGIKSIKTRGLFIFKTEEVLKDKGINIQLLANLLAVKKNDTVIQTEGIKTVIFLKNNKSIIAPGDFIICKGNISNAKKAYIPYQFDYNKFLRYKGVASVAYFDENSFIVKPNNAFNLKRYAFKLRVGLLNRLKKFDFNKSQLAVISAISLGERNGIDNDLYSRFSNAGLMHILAVSGMHVGILYLLLMFIFKPLTKNKKSSLIVYSIVLLVLWAYAFITGLSSSVVRADVMFSIMLIGKMLSKKYNVFNAVFASAFILLVYNPFYLFQLGFQLSYLAVLGIIFFQRKLKNIYQTSNFLLKYIWEIVCVSLSAQLTTTGIALLYFHKFPTYFLLSNIMVLFIVSALFITALLFYIFSYLPVINWLIYKALYFSSWLLVKIIALVNNLPNVSVENIAWNNTDTFLFYTFILLLVFYIVFKKRYILFSSIMFLFLMFANYQYRHYKLQNNTTIYLTNLSNNTALIYKHKKDVILNISYQNNYTSKEINYKLSGFLINNFASIKEIVHSSQNYLDIDNHFYKTGNFLKINDKIFYRYSFRKIPKLDKTLNVDFILIDKYFGEKIDDLFSNIQCKTLVLSPFIDDDKKNKLKNIANNFNVKKIIELKTNDFISLNVDYTKPQ